MAKFDIWLHRGAVTYSIFLPGKSAAQRFKGFDGSEGVNMLIGDKDCLIRVRIERAAAGALDDLDLVKGPRDTAKDKE